MRKVVALLVLASCSGKECPPQKSLRDHIVEKCGIPPRVESWEQTGSNGVPLVVVQDAVEYAKFTEWLVCTSKH